MGRGLRQGRNSLPGLAASTTLRRAARAAHLPDTKDVGDLDDLLFLNTIRAAIADTLHTENARENLRSMAALLAGVAARKLVDLV